MMPANAARRVRFKMQRYAATPESLARNVKALKGKPGYRRLRVGGWRILFKEDAQTIAVIRVAPRGRAYDR